MTHAQGTSRYALGLVVAVALAGCTSSPGTTGGAATAPAREPASTPTTLTCGTPPKELAERAAASIAAHPGPITATTYVFAATTSTGEWYVLGIDRSYVHDDGTPAMGPDGDHSRSLALANPARSTDGAAAMILLSADVSDKLPVSWDRVSWTGDTLAAGRRAADTAISCLEDRRRP